MLAMSTLFGGSANAQDPPQPTFKIAATWYTVSPEASSHPLGLDTADIFSADEFPDVVIVNQNDYSVSVFRNTGNWTANPPINGLQLDAVYGGLPDFPYDVEIADMDNVGGPDIVVTCQNTLDNGAKVVILFNNGAGNFGVNPRQEITTQSQEVRGLAIGDLDLNGFKDVALGGSYKPAPNLYAPQVEVLWQASLGTFNSVKTVVPPTVDVGGFGMEIVADRLRSPLQPPPPNAGPDLVMSMSSGPSIFVMRNEGNGNWTPDAIAQPGRAGPFIGAGRFWVGGGIPSPEKGLVSTDTLANAPFPYWPAAGDAVFALQTSPPYNIWPNAAEPYGLAVGRLNADTKVDFVVAASAGGSILLHGGAVVFVGRGNGTFVQPPPTAYHDVEPGGSPKPCFLKLADMDQNGRNDIVTGCTDSHKVSVLINTTP